MVKTDAFVKTKAGTLQGVCIDGIYRFLGVHYAETTGGENRFMPPVPVKPWEGVRPALDHVAKCWQTDHPRIEDKDVTCTEQYVHQQKLMVGSSEMGCGRQTEDCLAVNIWTQGLNDGKKRPVMVWLHGGGNFAGAAEADWHDGYNLAKYQDVVLVNVGHRLTVFGYINLAPFSEKYKNSANLGHQDMVAALKWINENIEAFGGDPNNVTIFGQSGGGMKVASLMAMPSAKGLFQRAIIQSGGYDDADPEVCTDATKQLLDFLGISYDNVDALLDIPPEDLIKAIRAINATRTLGTYLDFPVIRDGEVIKYSPFDGAEGSEIAKDIDLLSGYTKEDAALFALFSPELFSMSAEELPEMIKKRGFNDEDTAKLIEVYKELLPADHKPCDIYIALMNDQSQLSSNVDRYEARKKVGSKPMYNYCFCFEGPDEELKAIHGVDVPFFFDAAHYAPGLWNCDTYQGAMKLSKDAAAAWAAFARTGNPSNPAIPVWKPYEEVNGYTMLLDVESKQVSHYRKAALDIIRAAGK